MWFYVQHVLIPHQQSDAAIHDYPRGNLSDLYPRWLGARELLLHKRDPYSTAVTREIQTGYYGRELDPARPGDPKDQQAFAYPIYVVFLLAPTVTLPFNVVQSWFQSFLILLIVVSTLLWLRAIRWRPSPIGAFVLITLTLGSFPALQGIKLQQLSVVVSGLIAGSVALIVAGHLLSAGMLLALATIKPQLALPIAGWLVLWTLSNWRQWRKFFFGFAASMAMLLTAAHFILPGWLSRFRVAVTAYRGYTGGGKSLLDVLLTPTLGFAVSVIVVLIVVLVCWKNRLEPAESPRFALTTSLVVAATVVIIPMFAIYNQIMLLPGILLLIEKRRSILGKKWPIRVAWFVAGAVIAWPWAATAGLALASLAMPTEILERAWTLPLYTSLTIPVAVCGLLILSALEFGNPPAVAAPQAKED
ncbi:MAG: hypothetical protein NVS1B11_00310 [Terriglobales bacterium]